MWYACRQCASPTSSWEISSLKQFPSIPQNELIESSSDNTQPLGALNLHGVSGQHHIVMQKIWSAKPYTVKLTRAKLPANAGKFTCSSQVKRSLAQFTCVTCSLPVITGKFTCFEAASTSRRTHAHCLRAHVNLPEYHRYFTGSFTCGTHANLPATSMQNCLLLQAKIHATYRQKHWNRR